MDQKWIGSVGLVATILAIFLAVPLSVVANLLTPKIRDWYASTSRERLRRRLSALREKLKKLEATAWKLTRGEWEIFDLCYGIFLTLILMFYCTFIAIVGISVEIEGIGKLLGAKLDDVFENLPRAFQGLTVAGMFLVAICFPVTAAFFWVIDRLRTRILYEHTDEGEDRLVREIEKLQARAKTIGTELE